MNKKLLVCVLSVPIVAGCNWCPFPERGDPTPLVVLQVTETQNSTALERVIAELNARSFKAVVLVDADFANGNCQLLSDLLNDGYEIMAFVRPEEEALTMSMLSYEEQESLMKNTKAAIENCLGQSIAGFRCYRFDQNEDTYGIADSLGLQFNLGFVANSSSCLEGHSDDTLPYHGTDYEFWAVPMHSVNTQSGTRAFCDMPFMSLDAEDWEALLISEFDEMAAQGRPLLVEVHPYYSGVDEGRFQAFVSFLDYAIEQDAQFMTVAEYAQWAQ